MRDAVSKMATKTPTRDDDDDDDDGADASIRSARLIMQGDALIAEADRLMASGGAMTERKRLCCDAIAAFDAALDLDPRSALAHCRRGIAMFTLGELTGAVRCFEAALRLDESGPIHTIALNAKVSVAASLPLCCRCCHLLLPLPGPLSPPLIPTPSPNRAPCCGSSGGKTRPWPRGARPPWRPRRGAAER